MAGIEALFSSGERVTLDAFPEQVDLAAFWLTDNDRSELVGWRRSGAGRLAAGLQIGALRVLGFIPHNLTGTPSEAIDLVCQQLGPNCCRAHQTLIRCCT